MPAMSILTEQSGARALLGRQAACRWAARRAHPSSLAEERDVRRTKESGHSGRTAARQF